LAHKKRGSILNIAVDSYAAEGKSIAYLEDGKVLFVENAIPGDVVHVYITKNKKSWAEGKVTELVRPSPMRIAPFCPHFGICGGCKWQMLPYAQQLVYKQKQVADQLARIGHIQLPEISPIMGSPLQTYYRNKLEFTFSQQRYRTTEEIKAANGAPLPPEPAVGFHAPGLFDKVVPVQQCYLQPHPSNAILHTLRTYAEKNNLLYYDFRQQTGWLRNVIIRVATTGEVLVNLVIRHEQKEERIALLEHLWQEVSGITSLHYTINPKANDSLHDLPVQLYKGQPCIREKLENCTFNISPKSFFQTNTLQAENLYKQTRKLAGLTGREVLYDLYCGTGSIGIFCAPHARKVIGIEVVAQAIEDAQENARINGLAHCFFYTGDVSAVCTDDFFAAHGRPDVIITDPPRAGMHEKLIRQLLKMRAPRVVYVSCNPATQARDLQLLDEAYRITHLQPVDMFPHTHHIENIALLELRQAAAE
jgi:23S rRNA (uracil1939-C5)-methyltransferase